MKNNDNKASRECIICKSASSIKNYCNIDNLEYIKCETCGLIYVDNFADNEFMYSAYSGGLLKSFRRKLFAPIRKMKSVKGYNHFLERAREIFKFSKQYIKPDNKFSYLDIGCNKGFLLAAAIEDDCDVYGVELVREQIQPFCNTYPQFREQIYSEKFQSVSKKYPENYFDMITAIDVVEHFEDPLGDMCEIHRMLKSEGVFVIQTPDIECDRANQLRCEWGALKPLEHLHLFGGTNFVTFGKMAGFSDIKIYDAFEEADGNFVAVLKK